MKAVRFHEYGAPQVLRYEEVEQPVPGAGQVRLRVAATTFNRVDGDIRGGFMQGTVPVSLPHTPGLDVAGTVDALGEGVRSLALGDRVVGFLPMTEDGAAAEYVVAPAQVLAAAPATIALADAAALPTAALTAHQALFEHAGLATGQRILVNGAGGAVGGYAVQLAKRAGAHVIAVAGPRSRPNLEASGVDEIVDHTSTEVTRAVRGPVDVLLNLAPVEPERFTELVSLVSDGGVVVSTTVWMPTPDDESRGVRGIDVFVRSDAAQLAELVDLVDRGELTVDVGRRVPLPELPTVHEEALAGTLAGKVVVLAEAA
ncbi:NADP-dependent oxidoreductase [Nocardioides sp. cx-169]|uniref:NADP-dependent oxidoreductase n=1 Tax=Nocardioides sp. cx-169 TaxID=2899080 RepID=UPI001E586CC2|nr:NADP-dependent oxidoreductase [Nocardioides sp. cx-169]MCD4532684.1 NADP-dependent oxidoreductase [Nocardioides sp. cx-169]